MTLLITVFAAVIATVKWYNRKNDDMRLGILIFMYWGASIMWLVDAIFEFAELHEEYFSPAPMDMLNDAFLGLAVVALGLIVWVVRLLILDPKGVVKRSLTKN
jgi:predicted membrane channel-forming protein YqfA (hemolysin III family)